MKSSPSNRLFVAGFIATFVMTLLMYPASTVQIPAFDFASLINGLTGGFSWWVGLIIQFVIGAVLLPLLYRALFPVLPGRAIVKGIVFAFVLLFVVMAVAMPAMGFGVFALNYPTPALLWVSQGIVHIVYGILLGGIAGDRIRG